MARRTVAAIGLALAIGLVTGCSGSTLVPITPPPATPTPEPTPSPKPATPTPAPVESGQPTPTATPSPVELALSIDTAKGADDFHYAADALSAPAGSVITLTFTNRTDPDEEVGHNWVLVVPGQEESVLANGIAAGDDRDWLDTDDPGIIAATKLIEGDDADEITFDAPAAGAYTFLCTFPDHYKGGMKGTLTIE
ncbi:MAG TPA: plastocyanin/azurin family copper-binding protein [Candidatus Limnocylindrales bacterium]|nr:plastocyanin/azurin family copper-binding protein [Candidatus Limnocylindrales bacterium]